VARQERETAELIGGNVQKASGAMLAAKGDVRLKGVLRGEMKSTEKKSFYLLRVFKATRFIFSRPTPPIISKFGVKMVACPEIGVTF
jgi:hypothetical protein